MQWNAALLAWLVCPNTPLRPVRALIANGRTGVGLVMKW